MRLLTLIALMTVALAAQNPDRPWMQGTVEISCAREGSSVLEKMRKDFPNSVIKACACNHTCAMPDDPHAEETGGLKWDGRCEARCRVSNCNCPTMCDS